jgi:hypothetical protein
LIEKDLSFKENIPIPIEFIQAVSHSLSHHLEIPATVSQINLPMNKRGYQRLFLSGDRLYAAAEKTLYVFSDSDHKSPIATYQLSSSCYSGIIADNHLYLSVSD